MRIQTFSIVVGTRACNARCPFCVSAMTGFDELPPPGPVHVINLNKASRLAQLAGTTTVLFTGKGEPTLYPAEITEYLSLLKPWNFPLVELQTNGLEIGRLARDGKSRVVGLTKDVLRQWVELGLNTVAVSAVDTESEPNRQVYNKDYPDLSGTVDFLHQCGFTVRLCLMMMKGYVDTPPEVENAVDFCRAHGVEQLTLRPIRKPSSAVDQGAADWVTQHGLSREDEQSIQQWADQAGKPILSLMHGARVYDVQGQNVCLTDCLTISKDSDDIRTLIFYSNGRLSYDWQYDGAVILGGVSRPRT